MIKPTIVERDVSKQVVKPLKVGGNSFPTIKPKSYSAPPPPPPHEHIPQTSLETPLSEPSPLINRRSDFQNSNSVQNAFERELSQFLSPANIEFLKNRPLPKAESDNTDNSHDSIKKENTSETVPEQNKSTDPTQDSNVATMANMSQKRRADQMEVFDLDGRKVIDSLFIKSEMQSLFVKYHYENLIDKELWAKTVQVMLDEFLNTEYAVKVDETESSFSYEELLYVSPKFWFILAMQLLTPHPLCRFII